MEEEKNVINHRNICYDLEENKDQNLEKNCKERQTTLTNHLGQNHCKRGMKHVSKNLTN